MAFDCGYVLDTQIHLTANPMVVRVAILEATYADILAAKDELEQDLKGQLKKRDDDIQLLQYQMADLLAEKKRRKCLQDPGWPSAPAPPQAPVPAEPAPPQAVPTQALAQNPQTQCLWCGKAPSQWPDSKGYQSAYWPETMGENDIENWCKSIASRVAVADSSKMSQQLMRMGWIPANLTTGWLTITRSGKKARHGWVAAGCQQCGLIFL